ncbi:MAG: RNA polymerase II elongation factor [Chrysothrix sp. TS-e1954]|nr:MAG: RNA polymerase II elongation factor [Chrysothrix sp. TS-e1954]
MDAKEIERRGRDLTKANSPTQPEPPSVLLRLLSELKTGVRASEDLLRSTKIGITVNKLKQHKDPQVAQQAQELVGKWRRDVKEASGGSAKSPTGTASNGSPLSKGDKMEVDARSPGAAGKEKDRATVKPENRSAKADGVDCSVTGNPGRDNCTRLIYDGLSFMSEASPQTILALATTIETSAFTSLGPETTAPYRAKLRSLFTNLKAKSNPQLRIRLLSGEISPDRFVGMSSEELKSPERLAEDLAMQKENMDKAMVAQEQKSISGSMVCGKCGVKKVSYSQAQTRSADEPMTTFCECLNCGHRWKFS